MKKDKSENLFPSESFTEKLRSHTMDITLCVICLLAIYCNYKAKGQERMSTEVQSVNIEHVQEIKSSNTIIFNDSVRQKVR